MPEPARPAIGLPRQRAARDLRDARPALTVVAPGRRDFGAVRDLGYAPNPHALEGRHLEVAQLVALGLADKEIAHVLAISQGTVKGHVSTILRLLGLYRRTQICRYVHEAGLFPAT
ncbi:LuxR C-terminal-related transcriptional regulator [Paracoccaceae bacterium Fryx2]|nr:LuxR C-terminal-related transcriptional regulator [Paracoccaceae bacterium Fryx2]